MCRCVGIVLYGLLCTVFLCLYGYGGFVMNALFCMFCFAGIVKYVLLCMYCLSSRYADVCTVV